MLERVIIVVGISNSNFVTENSLGHEKIYEILISRYDEDTVRYGGYFLANLRVQTIL